jgi:hypothetical protein
LIQPAWTIVEGRHFAYYLTFLLGLVFFYRLCRRFSGKGAALAATLLFATQPLIFGHAFMNPKDPPFTALFIIAIELGFVIADAFWPQDGEAIQDHSGQRFQILTRRSFFDAWHEAALWFRIGIFSFLVIGAGLILDLFTLQMIQMGIKGMVSNAFAGTGWGPAVSLFNRVAQDLWKTPLDLYLEKVDTFFYWGRYVLGIGFFAFISGIALLKLKLKIHSKWILLLAGGIIVGMSVSTRILGGFTGVLGATVLFLRGRRSSIVPVTLYAGFAVMTTIALWPYLWANPLGNFFNSFQMMSAFPHMGTTIYNGQAFHPYELPRIYVPHILGVQLTIPALLFAVSGLIAVLVRKRPRGETLVLMIVLGWLGIPLAWSIFGERIFYANAHQMMFALPPLFLLSAYSFDWIASQLGNKMLVGAGLVALIPSIVGIVSLHPYEYLYYSPLVGSIEQAASRFSLDYWCTMSREGMLIINEIAPENATIGTNCEYTQIGAFARDDLKTRREPFWDEAEILLINRKLGSIHNIPPGMSLYTRIEAAGVSIGEIWVRPDLLVIP